MQAPISIQDKKTFIEWFLNHYQLKKRESVWILNYLVNHDNLLNNVHFIREAKFCPRGIIISSQCSDDAPFRFYKNHLVTTDAEKSFHDIRMNREEALYVQLNFHNSIQNASYVAVVEDNPFIPEDYYITKSDEETATQLLEKVVYDREKKKIQEAIDYSLDINDQHMFMKLTKKLHILESNNNQNQPKLLNQ
ncbi:ReoY family proteolytic degradation factor [Virgibacillus necropolis]|uniref:ReoY family proteolytic degradation factor n=1 Tax=Virgibacillus necropolis TaxID=163877 RepID=UPI00384AAD8A